MPYHSFRRTAVTSEVVISEGQDEHQNGTTKSTEIKAQSRKRASLDPESVPESKKKKNDKDDAKEVNNLFEVSNDWD